MSRNKTGKEKLEESLEGLVEGASLPFRYVAEAGEELVEQFKKTKPEAGKGKLEEALKTLLKGMSVPFVACAKIGEELGAKVLEEVKKTKPEAKKTEVDKKAEVEKTEVDQENVDIIVKRIIKAVRYGELSDSEEMMAAIKALGLDEATEKEVYIGLAYNSAKEGPSVLNQLKRDISRFKSREERIKEITERINNELDEKNEAKKNEANLKETPIFKKLMEHDINR